MKYFVWKTEWVSEREHKTSITIFEVCINYYYFFFSFCLMSQTLVIPVFTWKKQQQNDEQYRILYMWLVLCLFFLFNCIRSCTNDADQIKFVQFNMIKEPEVWCKMNHKRKSPFFTICKINVKQSENNVNWLKLNVKKMWTTCYKQIFWYILCLQ